MNTLAKIATAVGGLLLVMFSMGILTESGLFPRLGHKPFNGVYLAIGAPILVLGVWLARKGGLRPLRPFKR